ncbi:MAG: hypothetical protein IJG25_02130, partial [Thermoguttaceae bacterium]|nr:hypothetical protein [Thermoguttaceae bacterium]
ELGLIDEIGFLDDAIEAAESAAGIPHEKTEVVRYTKKEPLFKSLLGGGEGRFLPGAGARPTPWSRRSPRRPSTA